MTTPKSAIREFERTAAKGWNDGVSLDELLARVNHVAAKLFPVAEDGDSRVSPTFLPRTFRHYVTLGCIAPGIREGRRVVYGYRHFLQALLVRRLLAERVPARRMAELVTGGSDVELKRMLLGGVEIVARPGGETDEFVEEAYPGPAESWTRVRVMPGVELHIRSDSPKPGPAEMRRLLKLLEAALGQHQRRRVIS